MVLSLEPGTQTDEPEPSASTIAHERQEVQMVSVGPTGLTRSSNGLASPHVISNIDAELALGSPCQVAVLRPVVILGWSEMVMSTPRRVSESDVVQIIGELTRGSPTIGICLDNLHTPLIGRVNDSSIRNQKVDGMPKGTDMAVGTLTAKERPLTEQFLVGNARCQSQNHETKLRRITNGKGQWVRVFLLGCVQRI